MTTTTNDDLVINAEYSTVIVTNSIRITTYFLTDGKAIVMKEDCALGYCCERLYNRGCLDDYENYFICEQCKHVDEDPRPNLCKKNNCPNIIHHDDASRMLR